MNVAGARFETDTLEHPQLVEPGAVGSFAELGVSRPVIDALAKREIAGPFAIQALVLRDAIAGRDILARSQTGSGKTLAFAIPIVERLQPGSGPASLVLVPTRELASQVAEEFRGIADVRRLSVATVYGGVGLGEQSKRARRADIVIATPGRLLDLVARKMLRLNGVRIAVLDEADRMLDMGFMPDVRKILELLAATRQTMLFSATLDGEVGRVAQRFTRDAVLHEVADVRPTVSRATHRFLPVAQEEKAAALVRELAGERGLTLVFVRTKRGADRLAKQLRAKGFKAGALHGDMSQPQRERALAHFAAGQSDVLVATDVAARGLDLDDISHVVNYDPPADDKAYVHRVGRTARAGRTGDSVTFVTPEQTKDIRAMARGLELHDEFGEGGFPAPVPTTRPAGAGRRPGRGGRGRGQGRGHGRDRGRSSGR